MIRVIKNPTFQVLTAIALGAALGSFHRADAQGAVRIGGVDMDFVAKYFIECVKQFIYLIIPITIVGGIAGMGDLKKVGRIGGKALIYFEVVTTFALIIGIAVALVVQPGAGMNTSHLAGNVEKYQKAAAQFSWLHFLQTNITLDLVLASVAAGVVLNYSASRVRILNRLHHIGTYVFAALSLLMRFAPIGAFAGMAFTVGKYGLKSLASLGSLMFSVYATMFLFIFIVLNAVMRYSGMSLWQFLGYIKEEILIVLGTSSSEAALPSLMKKLTRMGCRESVVGLVVPAGYSFNLDGTTIYLAMATIFLAQAFQAHLSYQQIFTLIGVLLVTSKGAAGVTGSGFVVLASTIASVPSIPIQGLALLLGVDRFMSEARAITNIIGNGVATVALAINEQVFDREAMETAYQAEKKTDLGL